MKNINWKTIISILFIILGIIEFIDAIGYLMDHRVLDAIKMAVMALFLMVVSGLYRLSDSEK